MTAPDIPIIRGRRPVVHEKEYREWSKYESGSADIDAAQVPGPFPEPWLNVVRAFEPASMPAFDRLLSSADLRRRIRGTVLDIGAGSCWLTAKVSLLPDVDRVFSVDLSEGFLCGAGLRVLRHLGAEMSKVTFVASDFNELPLESGLADCAFLFATLHHSLAPIRTLREVGRCVRTGGVMFILENPASVRKIRQARRTALGLSADVTEIAYTLGELEYLIDVAAIGKASRFTYDILSSAKKMPLRRLVRRFGLENVLLDPPTYLWAIEKP